MADGVEKGTAVGPKTFPLSATDRIAIYDHLMVASGLMLDAKNLLRAAQERHDSINDILNKMVPPLK